MMKRLIFGIIFTFGFCGSVFAQQQAAKCEDDLEVMKTVYATTKMNAEVYLESAARLKVKMDQMKVQLDEALGKLKAFEVTPPAPEK